MPNQVSVFFLLLLSWIVSGLGLLFIPQRGAFTTIMALVYMAMMAIGLVGLIFLGLGIFILIPNGLVAMIHTGIAASNHNNKAAMATIDGIRADISERPTGDDFST